MNNRINPTLMKAMLLSLILLITVVQLSAQTPIGIKEIRNHYYQIGEQIKSCEQGNENCALFQDRLALNERDQPWPGTGIYQKEVRYFYDRVPELAELRDEEAYKCLQKIELRTITSAVDEYSEFLLLDGRVVFYYLKNALEENYVEEYRFYFNEKGSLIRYMIGQEEQKLGAGPPPFDMESLHLTLQGYIEQFLMLHN